MDYNNSICQIVEYQIAKPEMFHDPYPYKELERYQLPNYEIESLKLYKKYLKFAENDQHLVYCFYKHETYLKMLRLNKNIIQKVCREI